jgi:hypothetical protein
MRKVLVAAGLLLGVAACSAQVADFMQKAAPQIMQACTMFRQAEADPMVQLALAGGSTAATMVTGAPVGQIVAEIRSYGDAFCQSGPPMGDATTPAQQTEWLASVTMQMLSAAGALKM